MALTPEELEQMRQKTSSYSPFGGISVSATPAAPETEQSKVVTQALTNLVTPAWQQDQQAATPQPQVAPANQIDLTQLPTLPSTATPMSMGELSGGLSGIGVPQVGQAPQQISGLPQAGALSDLAGSAPDTAPTYDPTVRPLPNLQDAPVGALGTAPDVMSQQFQSAPAPQVDAPVQPQGLAAFGGRTLSQYLTDPTVEGAGLMTDAQGRMIDPTVDRSKFEAASAARSAAAGPNLQSIAGAPRPGVDVPSLAMQRSRMEAGLDPVAGAPTGMSQQQQRDQLERGVDPATGKRIQPKDDGLTPYQRASLQWQKDKFSAEQASKAFDRALKMAESAEEKAALQQEMNQKEQDIYTLNQDRFTRQERYIDQVLANTSGWSTGIMSTSGILPGTPAHDLRESLKPIIGEAAFGRLQEMREASKTGGALGQVSEKELALLEASMGALSSSQTESQFRANLLAYRKQLRKSNAAMQAAAKGQPWFDGGGSGGGAPRYANDVDDGQPIDDILLPPSK